MPKLVSRIVQETPYRPTENKTDCMTGVLGELRLKMNRVINRGMMYALMGSLFWQFNWFVGSVPIKQKFEAHYIRMNFTLSQHELAQVAALMKKINQVSIEGQSSKLDEKEYDMVESWSGHNETNEASKNKSRAADDYLFEGDILLTPKQASGIWEQLNGGDEENGRVKRTAVSSNKQAKWTLPIKYDIDPRIDSTGVRAIEDALEYWRTHTCVWFQRQSGPSPDDYMYFFQGTDDSCYSHVGKLGGKQPISVGRNCEKLGYVAHEIGHSLGMWHEQARPDSDQYVRIVWQNVENHRSRNFLKRTWAETETYGIPYDLGSVMHYGPYAFSANEKGRTVETLVQAYRNTIGQREAPSFLDVKVVNKMYCNGKCKTEYSCSRGGYTHPGFCNGCLCPDGLTGTYCDEPEAPKNAYCGGLIHVTDDWTNISSPNYPQKYSNNQRCSWLLRSPAGTRIAMEFIDVFQLGCQHTCSDYVEVKTDTDFANTGIRYCCYERPNYSIYSQSNEMLVIFHSGYTSYYGFKAQVSKYPRSR